MHVFTAPSRKSLHLKFALVLFLLLFAIAGIAGVATHAAGNEAVSLPFDTSGDTYPAGQCTWFANGRYHALHGIFVPWTPWYNAKDWTAVAYQYGWSVSTTPQIGDIMDLQPYVQWAGPLGHVAIVEQMLPNGDVLASNRNWGLTTWQQEETRLVEFTPGSGVTFIHHP